MLFPARLEHESWTARLPRCWGLQRISVLAAEGMQEPEFYGQGNVLCHLYLYPEGVPRDLARSRDRLALRVSRESFELLGLLLQNPSS